LVVLSKAVYNGSEALKADLVTKSMEQVGVKGALPYMKHPLELVSVIKVAEMVACMVCALLHTVMFNRRN